MNMKPMVSIIIPVYNVEQYLDKCMDTVLHQTYSVLDIVLVDDGSKDGSSKMCDEYAQKDNRIQVLHKENGGLMSAWIAGVKIAKGDYLLFVDSDDWIELNMVEELVHYTNGSLREIICSNYIIEKIEKKQAIKIKQSMNPGIYDRQSLEKELFPQMLGLEERRIHSSRCMKLISTRLIKDNIQYTNPAITMGEDLNIMFSAILDAERIVIVEEGYYYHYRFVDASMAHKYNAKLYEKINLLNKTLKNIIEKKLDDSKKQDILWEGLRKEYIFLMFLVLKNELRGPRKNLSCRIREIIQDSKKENALEDVKITVNSKANKLLYYIWKNPSVFRVMLGRIAIKMFDRM